MQKRARQAVGIVFLAGVSVGCPKEPLKPIALPPKHLCDYLHESGVLGEMECLKIGGQFQPGDFGPPGNLAQNSITDCNGTTASPAFMPSSSPALIESYVYDVGSYVSFGGKVDLSSISAQLPSIGVGIAGLKSQVIRIEFENPKIVTYKSLGIVASQRSDDIPVECVESLCADGTYFVVQAIQAIPRVSFLAESGLGGGVGATWKVVEADVQVGGKNYKKIELRYESDIPVTFALKRRPASEYFTHGNICVASEWWPDKDGDGYGDMSAPSIQKPTKPDGYASNASDCDDTRAAVHPGSTEVCDGLDNDCDGTSDGDDAIGSSTFYLDDDRDGSGNECAPIRACSKPDGAAANADDPDDNDPTSTSYTRTGVTLFEHGEYGGRSLALGLGFNDVHAMGFNDMASSIKVRKGYRAVACNELSMDSRHGCHTFDGDSNRIDACCMPVGNDAISAVEVTRKPCPR